MTGASGARTWREVRELWQLAAPIAFAQAGQALMGIVDTAVVGRVGAVQLAAVGLANALYLCVLVFGMGLMLGLDPLISQAFGAGDALRARRLLWSGLRLATVVALALSIPLAVVPLALGPAGISREIASETGRYLYWRLPSVVPALLFIAARSYLQAANRTRSLVVATIAANAINLLAAILLVFGGSGLPGWSGLRWVPAMGVAGAALATVLCTFLQLGIVAWAIRMKRPAGLGADAWRGSPEDIRKVIRTGLPVGAHQFAEVGAFVLVAVLAAGMGPDSGAAHQICITYANFTFCIVVGVGAAGSVRVGWAIGAGDTPQARRSGLTAFAAGMAFMGTSALVFFCAPRLLASAMTGEPEVLAVTVPLLRVAAAFQLSDGLQGVGAGVLRGAGDTRFTFAANLAGHYGVGLPVALALSFAAGLGVVGLWWGLCAGLTAVGVTLLYRFSRLSSKPIRPLVEAAPLA
jgi:MATE family multidrug resistance protein